MIRPALLASMVMMSASAVTFAADKASATVNISGGPNAGKHEITVGRGGCSAGLTGKNSFGTQISGAKDPNPKKLDSVQLDLPDRSKPNEFRMTVGFGSILNRGAEYTIDTRAKKGNGGLTLADNGSTASVKVSGTTAEGVKLDVAIDCKSVLRAG